jgi:predicted glycosyl hydrolase (DUF1957 family)
MEHFNAATELTSTGAESALDARSREILDFERSWWRFTGAKEQAVRDRFDLSSSRYYELLNALLDDADALAYDPMLVRRLRRMRSARQRERAARRTTADAS